jgi:hypothetical protein
MRILLALGIVGLISAGAAAQQPVVVPAQQPIFVAAPQQAIFIPAPQQPVHAAAAWRAPTVASNHCYSSSTQRQLFTAFRIGEGCASPPTCGNLASERTFVFGSCNQFFNAGCKCSLLPGQCHKGGACNAPRPGASPCEPGFTFHNR